MFAKSTVLLCLLTGMSSALLAQTVFTPGILREDFYTPSDATTGQGALDGFLTTAMAGPSQMTLWWNSFGPWASGNNQGDNYGEVISGYVIPPATGNYEFYLRSDDPGELFISTDDKPANLGATPIALQAGCCNAFTSTEDGTLSSAPVALTAGKKYFIRAMHVEGGGDDYIQIGWRTPLDTSLTNPPTSVIPAAYIGADAPSAGASVAITTSPSNVTAAAGSSATFTIAYTTQWNSKVASFTNTLANPPANWPPTFALVTSGQTQDANAATDASIVWFKNGKPIEMESSATLTIPVTTTADTGAQITAQVSVPGAVATSSAATLTVTANTKPPVLVHATGDPSLTGVHVKFDTALDAATAGNAANYTISPSITVTAAAIDKTDLSESTVVLTTASQTPATKYTLTVSNVKDLSGNVIAANSTRDFYSGVFASGAVSMKYWYNVSGNTIANLQSDPRFPSTPDFSTLLTDWEYPPYNGPWTSPAVGNNEAGSNYGNEIVGFFIPAKTGNYVFFTCSDDPSNLYLSTDSNPANKKLIAQEMGWSNPRSWNTVGSGDPTAKRSDQFSSSEWPGAPTISLTAGKQYYLESQHTEGGGGDNVEATFKLDTDPDPNDGDASKLTGALIATTIPADGFLANTTPGAGATQADPDVLGVNYVTGVAKFDTTTAALKLDGTAVTPQFSTNGSVAILSYTISPILTPGSKHTAELDYPLADGSTATNKWSFQVASYFTLTPDLLTKPDTNQPGFIWNMSQVADIGTYAQNSLARTVAQLAGQLGPNTADPNAVGAAAAKGTPNSNPNLPIVFKIPTVINLVKATNTGPFGNFQPDLQMPGSPGTDTTTDNQAAEIDTFITLPAGLIRMGVNSDDDFETYVGPVGSVTNLLGSFEGGRGASDSIFLFSVQEAGTYAFRTLWENGGGDSNIEWFTINNGKDALINDTKNGGYPAYQAGTASPGTGGGASFTGVSVTADKKTATLTYTGTLQSGSSVTGPWTDVAGATSPATIQITTANKALFYRVH